MEENLFFIYYHKTPILHTYTFAFISSTPGNYVIMTIIFSLYYLYMENINIIDTLCIPAKYFLIIITTYVLFNFIFKFFFNNKNKDIKIGILFFLLLVILGWTSIINFFCNIKQTYITWLLFVIPILYILYKKFIVFSKKI